MARTSYSIDVPSLLSRPALARIDVPLLLWWQQQVSIDAGGSGSCSIDVPSLLCGAPGDHLLV